MSILMIIYEDKEEFERAHQSRHAWDAIDNAYNLVRSQLKHGDESKDRQVLETIKSILDDVRWRVE